MDMLYPNPYRKGRLNTLEAIRTLKLGRKWTAAERATRLKHTNRYDTEYRSYYAGKISVLKSHLSTPCVASRPRVERACPTWSNQKLIPHREPLSILEYSCSVMRISLLVSVLCWLALAWLSPIAALVLSLAIGSTVHFLIEEERDKQVSTVEAVLMVTEPQP